MVGAIAFDHLGQAPMVGTVIGAVVRGIDEVWQVLGAEDNREIWQVLGAHDARHGGRAGDRGDLGV